VARVGSGVHLLVEGELPRSYPPNSSPSRGLTNHVAQEGPQLGDNARVVLGLVQIRLDRWTLFRDRIGLSLSK
jgi:hypothetical protein